MRRGNRVDGLHVTIRDRTKKPLATALSGAGRGSRKKTVWVILPMYNISLFRIVTMNPPVQRTYPN
jgi:hypothetical protein